MSCRHPASFGGFLNRKHDGFPGAQSLWIGLQRTRDFAQAIEAERASPGQDVYNGMALGGDLQRLAQLLEAAQDWSEVHLPYWIGPGCE